MDAAEKLVAPLLSLVDNATITLGGVLGVGEGRGVGRGVAVAFAPVPVPARRVGVAGGIVGSCCITGRGVAVGSGADAELVNAPNARKPPHRNTAPRASTSSRLISVRN